MLDAFVTADEWAPVASPGVALGLSADGGALRLDVDFGEGGGYAIARKAFALRLPERYAFRYRLRAERPGGGAPPVQDFEFKLVDASGENVWWHNRRRFRYPAAWTALATRDRHVGFAWGPQGGGRPEEVAAVEFVVTAVEGGRMTVWLDDFTFERLPDEPPLYVPPTAAASSGDAAIALDNDPATAWGAASGPQTLTLDLGARRELGGVALDWRTPPSSYNVTLSNDGATWSDRFEVAGAHAGRALIPLPESEARFVRLDVEGPSALGEATVLPVGATASPTTTLMTAAALAPPGRFPRHFAAEQGYWTVVGVDGDDEEALVGEDGHVEVRRGGPSLEPFLYHDGRLLGWYEADTTVHSLERGDLSIPTVERRHGDLRLKVTAFVDGAPGRSELWVRYRVENVGAQADTARLFVALRPFQVNPPPQFLGTAGGAAEVRRLVPGSAGFFVDSTTFVLDLGFADAIGAAAFAQGDVTAWLAAGTVPPRAAVEDPAGLASGALAYDLVLAPGEVEENVVMVRLSPLDRPPFIAREDADIFAAVAEQRQRDVASAWAARLDAAAQIVLPPEQNDLAETVHTTLAYVLINRDGPRIQPGSRSYDRSWIRDGALTSSALLRFGLSGLPEAFARWYAPFQGADGFVPCCVGRLGADWTLEHDSHGQLLFLIAEVHRYTGDDAFLHEMWPHVLKAAAIMDALRHRRMTPVYRADSLRAYYGLLPESISHEGYSAKPMHSYWDQLFALRGLKDAVYVAEALGEDEEAARLAAQRDAFAADLGASYRRAMATHAITYLPGSVELGDFDATSVTVAMDPVDAGEVLPQGALEATFERYWGFFERRRADSAWNDYTPYEWRNVGAFVRLGWPERAHEALRWFMGHRRPLAWNAFAEVVGREARRPRFVGDIPHGWVGSDFLRAVADLFCFEEGDRLILGAGVPLAWLEGGAPVGVRELRTHHGPLSFLTRRDGETVAVEIEAGVEVPPGGLVVRAPFGAAPVSAEVDGRAAPLTPGSGSGSAVVRSLPARVVFHY